MISINKRKTISPFLKQIIFFVILFLLIALVAWPLYKKLVKSHEVDEEISQLETEISDLDKKNSDLRKLIDYLESDQFVDAQARENLNFKKEGEEMVVIKDSDISTIQKNDETLYRLASEAEINKELNPSKWFSYFFN